MQTLIIALIIVAAATYIGRRVWQTVAAARAPKGAGCASGCGCEPSSPTSARH